MYRDMYFSREKNRRWYSIDNVLNSHKSARKAYKMWFKTRSCEAPDLLRRKKNASSLFFLYFSLMSLLQEWRRGQKITARED